MSTKIECELHPVIADSREAFGEIVRRYQNMVSAVTFSMTGNLQQSEDLAQETFVAAWQNQRELRDPEKLPAWLCGIARNLSRNWLRRTETERLARSAASLDGMPENGTHPNPAGKLEREEQAALLWATLEKIPEPYREPLVMFYRQNQAVSEIAAALETSEENVRQRLVRGRAYLKEEVQQLVESALETLQPGPGFAMAVLAAIPATAILTAQTAVASTATIGTIGGKSSGAFGAAGMFGVTWFVAVVWGFFVAVVIPLVGQLSLNKIFFTSLRNFSTVRSRRWRLKQLMIYISVCYFSVGCFFAILGTSCSDTTKFIGCFLTLFFHFNWMTFQTFVSARKTRRFLEEDAVSSPASSEFLEKMRLSRKNLRITFWLTLCIAILGMSGMWFFLIQITLASPTVFHWSVCVAAVLFLLLWPFMHIRFYRIGMQMASEEGLQKFPPLYQNTLDILLGRRELPKTESKAYQKRYFSIDLVGMGTLMFGSSYSFVLLGLAQPHPWPGYLLIGCVLALFFIFGKCFAGKPKWRYLGWIVISIVMCVLYLLTLYVILKKPLEVNLIQQLSAHFYYSLFGLIALLMLMSYCCFFEKEIDKKLGTSKKDKK